MYLYCYITFSFAVAETSISYIKDKVTINTDSNINFPMGTSPNICYLEHYLSFRNENYIGNCLTVFLRKCGVFCLACFNCRLKISLVLNLPNPTTITDTEFSSHIVCSWLCKKKTQVFRKRLIWRGIGKNSREEKINPCIYAVKEQYTFILFNLFLWLTSYFNNSFYRANYIKLRYILRKLLQYLNSEVLLFSGHAFSGRTDPINSV